MVSFFLKGKTGDKNRINIYNPQIINIFFLIVAENFMFCEGT